MTQLMLKAMREGKMDFVRLLISECIDIQKFLFNNRDRLYAAKYVSILLTSSLNVISLFVYCETRFSLSN